MFATTIQHMSNEQGTRLKAHTLFIGQVLFLSMSHSNEHREHHEHHIIFTMLTRNIYKQIS